MIALLVLLALVVGFITWRGQARRTPTYSATITVPPAHRLRLRSARRETL